VIKTITVEQRYCDFCDKEAYPWTVCLGCGKDLCPPIGQQSNSHSIKYPHGVNVSGSDDGYYCLLCDVRLSETKDDPLHQAYAAVRALRDESTQAYEALQQREKSAEAEIRRARAARGL
jgi:hypothetical protein